MDFSNRSNASQPQQSVAPSVSSPVGPVGKKSSGRDNGKWGRIGFVAAIAAVVILLVGVALLTSTGSTGSNENKYVDTTKLQAVFLNTGQVYFGNVRVLNSRYFVLTNIYYLQTASSGSSTTSTNANTNVSLVKLGCELHEPYDQMVINRTQVTFWENLQGNGQVAKAVTAFEKQNPNGQKCADQSSSAGTNSVNSTQNAGSNSSTTTPTTTTTTTKKP